MAKQSFKRKLNDNILNIKTVFINILEAPWSKVSNIVYLCQTQILGRLRRTYVHGGEGN